MNGTNSRGGWRLWASVAAVFVAGVIVGGLATGVLIRSHVVHVMRSGPPRIERVLGHMTMNLELTAAQRAQVDSIRAEFKPRFEAFDRRSRAEVRGIADEMESRIRALLTPAQQSIYDRNLARMHEEFRRRHRHESSKE